MSQSGNDWIGVDEVNHEGARQIVRQIACERNLSSREYAVLAGATRGESAKQIAYTLGISGSTVAYFWARIFRKLGCGSQVQVMSLLFRRAIDARPALKRKTR